METLQDRPTPRGYPPAVSLESVSPEVVRMMRPSASVCWAVAVALVLVACACAGIAYSIHALSESVRDAVAVQNGGK